MDKIHPYLAKIREGTGMGFNETLGFKVERLFIL